MSKLNLFRHIKSISLAYIALLYLNVHFKFRTYKNKGEILVSNLLIMNIFQTEKWVTIEKTQKIVQSRLKVITTASTVQPSPQEFTPLFTSSLHNDSKSPPLQIKDEKEFPDLITQTKIISSTPKFW